MQKITLKSIAKINLGLVVKEKRDDGFHNIETIFYPLHDIFDTLTFEASNKSEFISNIELPFDKNNLIFRAKRELEKFVGEKLNVKITLDKNIPIGAGLGGGSSNAATTLKALQKLFSIYISEQKLYEIALRLGSDVPFFLLSKPAFAEGRGEKLTPIKIKINKPIVLINPKIHISTATAYRRTLGFETNILRLEAIIKSVTNNFENADEFIVNDFERYVFYKYPKIGGLLLDFYANGAKFSRMTGTGSTVFGIFENVKEAKKSISSLSKLNYITLLSKKHG